MRRIAIAATFCAVGAFLLGGAGAFGRVALSLGAPGIAAGMLDDPAGRGVAQYRAGNFDAAAAEFDAAGSLQDFNAGNALAMAGRYAAALEAYDRQVAQQPADTEAEANFDLVAAIYAGTEIQDDAPVSWFVKRDGATMAAPLGKGAGRAAGTGDGVTNTGALIGLPELETSGQLGVRKVFDDKFVPASPRWLATLPDVPGEYLAERIKAEHKRRAKAGLSPPPPEDLR